MAQWLEIFPEMKSKKLYLTGESVTRFLLSLCKMH